MAAAFTVLTPVLAQAAFEWAPPAVIEQKVRKKKKAPMPAVAAAPVTTVDIIDTTTGATPAMPLPSAPADMMAPSLDIADYPLQPMPDEIGSEAPLLPAVAAPAAVDTQAIAAPMTAPVPMAAPSYAAPDMNYAEVAGFGEDIPMALVLQQVVPSGYSYAFDKSVDPGMRLSWNGGRPWNVVLEDALRVKNMTAVISGNTIWVRPYGQVATAATAAPAYNDTMTPEPPLSEAEKAGVYQQIRADEKNYAPSYPRRRPPAMQQAAMQEPVAAPVQQLDTMASDMPAQQEPWDLTAGLQTQNPVPQEYMPADMYKATPVAEVPAPQPAGPFDIQYWEAKKGQSLRETLRVWAEKSGATLYWQAMGDYFLPENIALHGTFSDVVSAVLDSYTEDSTRPLGQLYQDQEKGPMALVIRNETATLASGPRS